MADKRIFTIEIDGIKKSYDDINKLINVLSRVDSSVGKLSKTIQAAEKATEKSSKTSMKRAAAMTEEEKAAKKLAETQEKATRQITAATKAQEAATAQLQERTKEIQLQVREESAATNSIEAMRVELSKLTDEWKKLDTNSDKFKEASAEINKLTEKLNEAEQAAANAGKHSVTIAETSDKLKKLSSGINITTQVAKDMVSTFQLGISVFALFSNENKTLSSILSQTSKIISVLEGVEKLYTAATSTQNTLNKARIVLDTLVTKGIISQTVAQTALNIATYAFPAAMIIAGIGAIVAGLASFISSTDEATKSQNRLLEAANNSLKLKDQFYDNLKRKQKENIDNMEEELALMRSQGASQDAIAKKEKEIADQKQKDAQIIAKKYKDERESLDENTEAVNRHLEAIEKLEQDYKNGLINEETYTKNKAAEEAQYNYFNTKVEQGIKANQGLREANKEVYDQEAASLAKSTENNKKYAESAKRNALALAEYKVLVAKKGSEQELQANIDLVNQEMLNSLSAENITQGEILKIRQNALLKIKKLQSDYRKKNYDDELTYIKAQMEVVKKGSLEEYNLKIQELDKLKEKELDNEELTQNQRLLIINKYNKDILATGDALFEEQAKAEIQTNIATINTVLAKVKEGSQDEYDLKTELAKTLAEQSKQEIEKSITNEEEKAAKIKEINAQLQRDLQTITKSKKISAASNTKSEETLELTKQLHQGKISQDKYQEEMLNSQLSFLDKSIAAQKEAGESSIDLEVERELALIAKQQAFYQKLMNTIQMYSDFESGIYSALNSLAQAEIDQAKDKLDEVSQAYDEITSQKEESDQRIIDLQEKAIEAGLNRSNTYKEQIATEMEANKELANQQADLAKKKEKLEADIAKKEKKQKKAEAAQQVLQAGVNTALGITAALSTANITKAILVGAMGAVQTAVAAANYAKMEKGGLLDGKRHSEGGMKIEGTNIEVEGGEYVVNRKATAANLDILEAMNSSNQRITPIYTPPVNASDAPIGIPNAKQILQLDYSSLADAFKEVSIKPTVSVVDINKTEDSMTTAKEIYTKPS